MYMYVHYCCAQAYKIFFDNASHLHGNTSAPFLSELIVIISPNAVQQEYVSIILIFVQSNVHLNITCLCYFDVVNIYE